MKQRRSLCRITIRRTHAHALGIWCLFAALIVTAAARSSGANPENDPWPEFVSRAAEEHGEPGRKAAEFLLAHRPDRDREMDLGVLIENLDYAMRARKEFPWARNVPEEIFLNDVLPYAVFDETREAWRAEMYETAKAIVADCTTASEAAQALNREIFNAVNVHYNTGRKRPNQSPSESIAQGRATCTGLSIILIDACRAVGVPARGVGVASWTGKAGNHTWVEVWDGSWHFTGADEYDANGLDRAWFEGDASRAQGGDPRHAVWATSWRDTGHTFPMVWTRATQDVPGVNVTHRYVVGRAVSGTQAVRHLRAWDTEAEGADRLALDIRVLDPDGEQVASVTTRAGTSDLNDMPSVTLVPGVRYRLEARRADELRVASLVAPEPDEQTLDLRWDALSLHRTTAESLLESMWHDLAAEIRAARSAELADGEFVIGDRTLRVLERTFGDAPANGRSLWISLHGGGGAPAEVNDRQWKQPDASLYEPAEGIYIAPRAPTDTWNLWHEAHIDPLFDRAHRDLRRREGRRPRQGVPPGLLRRRRRRIPARPPNGRPIRRGVSMMAGHPNEDLGPLGLRNLPFAIFMGGKDSAYKRNEVARQSGATSSTSSAKTTRPDTPTGSPSTPTGPTGWAARTPRRCPGWPGRRATPGRAASSGARTTSRTPGSTGSRSRPTRQ
jgi:hypothetical protein